MMPINTSRNLLKVIVNRHIRFVGHIVTKSQLEAITSTGIIKGKTGGGKQRKTFMDWISSACGEQWKIKHTEKFAKNGMRISPMSKSDRALTSDRIALIHRTIWLLCKIERHRVFFRIWKWGCPPTLGGSLPSPSPPRRSRPPFCG